MPLSVARRRSPESSPMPTVGNHRGIRTTPRRHELVLVGRHVTWLNSSCVQPRPLSRFDSYLITIDIASLVNPPPHPSPSPDHSVRLRWWCSSFPERALLQPTAAVNERLARMGTRQKKTVAYSAISCVPPPCRNKRIKKMQRGMLRSVCVR